MLKITELKTEYRINPIGMDELFPRFSWKIVSDNQNVYQTAYHIIVDGAWDSGMVENSESVHIEYAGCKLKPKTEYNVKIKVRDNYNEESDWVSCKFETGFLGENLWKAKWLVTSAENKVVPVFKKNFIITEIPEKARLYATSYGIYDIYINGSKVSDYFMTPGFTSYKKRLQYQVYNPQEYLVIGENIIEIYLSKGWCCGRYPFQKGINPYHMNPGILAQLELDDTVIPTDETWECSESKLRFCEIYDGEFFDNSFDATNKIEYTIGDYGFDNIIGHEGEYVKIIDEVMPKEILITRKGETVIDFGQNLVGFVEFSVTGKKGDKVSVSHAEVLDKDGNFYTDNLRTAKQKIEYVINGGTEKYHARMTFQGFRYIRIDSYPGEIKIENFVAHVVSSDMERIGYFESSHKLLNQLYNNVIWGQKGNFLDIPTDCPQRDERAGWTGDIQVFCKTAVQNTNSALFFKKWLSDVIADQTDEGACLILVPSMNEVLTSSGWGDAAVVCPWEVYMAYGDKKLLKRQYDSMKKWVEYIKNQGDNPYLWNTGHHFGDWLAIDAPEGSMRGATTHEYIASAYYAYSTSILIKTAEVLGYSDDVIYYQKLYDNILKNIINEYFEADGNVRDNTQTANVLALKFNLSSNKEILAEKLCRLVKENGDKLTTGFLGTPYLCDALFENGCIEKAFDILLQEEYPSWLFSVKMGATTIWEHWDGIKPDGSFWRHTMNSYNHYAYGSIADFMYTKIGGITPIEAGYKKIRIEPVTDKRIAYAKTSIDTLYGIVSTSWSSSEDTFELTVTIPCNTTAEIIMPDGRTEICGSGTYKFIS